MHSKNSQRRRKINAILHKAFGGSPPEFEDVTESDESEVESESGKVRNVECCKVLTY